MQISDSGITGLRRSLTGQSHGRYKVVLIMWSLFVCSKPKFSEWKKRWEKCSQHSRLDWECIGETAGPTYPGPRTRLCRLVGDAQYNTESLHQGKLETRSRSDRTACWTPESPHLEVRFGWSTHWLHLALWKHQRNFLTLKWSSEIYAIIIFTDEKV